MSSSALDNLVKIGTLKREDADSSEIAGLILSARNRLNDSQSIQLSLESRFDLSYNAAHALALAALRLKGYRSENRFAVFQALSSTSSLTNAQVRILSDAHNRRNRIEYDGQSDVGEKAIEATISVAKALLDFLDNQIASAAP